MARRRFFVEAVHSGRAQISGADAHHLTRVLRVEAGQKFEISDDRDVYLAEVETARKDLVSFSVIEKLEIGAPSVHLHLYAALIRFERFEWIIEKATELGAARITPVDTDRSEKGLGAAASKRLARWTRIAREASEQSRRAHLPLVDGPVALTDALTGPERYRFALEEDEAAAILSALPPVRSRGDAVALLVGPEGGWTKREREAIRDAGWTAVSLGDNILRAETAAVAGLSIVAAAWDVR